MADVPPAPGKEVSLKPLDNGSNFNVLLDNDIFRDISPDLSAGSDQANASVHRFGVVKMVAGAGRRSLTPTLGFFA